MTRAARLVSPYLTVAALAYLVYRLVPWALVDSPP